MRRIIFTLILTSILLSIPFHMMADEGLERNNIVRFFLHSGETLDFNAALIDSIATTATWQTVWYEDTCRMLSVKAIDSICYLSPVLRLTTRQLDFGKVAVGNAKSLTVTITNQGKYPESYSLFADGVFKASDLGDTITLAAEESREQEVIFVPIDTIPYSGNLLLLSNAIDKGMVGFPLRGKGVRADSLEESVLLPPVEQDFNVVLSADQTPESLDGFKIVNSYGEFPLSVAEAARAHRAARLQDPGSANYSFPSAGAFSPNGMQLQFLTDSYNLPFLFSITLPDEQPEISVEETAIALLMTDPMLITNNEAEFRNTVKTIKSLESYSSYLKKVELVYFDGLSHHRCPTYSSIDMKPVIAELASKVLDNRELTLSGVSLTDQNITPESARFKVHNILRRSLHLYPSRANIDNDHPLGADRDDLSPTLSDKLKEWLEDAAKEGSSVTFDDEDEAYLEELILMVDELEAKFATTEFGSALSSFHLPIILDSQHSNYWKIVKGSLQGETSSPFEVVSNEIEIKYDNANRALLDIYGLGIVNKPWDSYTEEERFRIVVALLYGAYKDFVIPIIDFSRGAKSLSVTPDDYKYDLRYGARKYPVWALIVKLCSDLLFEDPQTLKTIKDDIEKGDWWETAKEVVCFLYDRICTKPEGDSPEDKRTYMNLIYNIYKKYSNTPATSKAFKDNFKAVSNYLTALKSANYVSKVISLSELGLDMAGSIDAARLSKVQETFVINKSIQPYITMTAPTMVLTRTDSVLHFEWSTHKGDLTTPFIYQLELIVENPDAINRSIVVRNIKEDSVNYDLSTLSVPANTQRIYYRVIAHHPQNEESVIVMTQDILLASFIQEEDHPRPPVFYDLQLPSGNLWAACNLGAQKAEDPGDYYAWGEKESDTSFSWKNYQYCAESSTTLTRYCTKSYYGYNGYTDHITELQGGDDPAASEWGYYYSIPTKEDWEELMTHCTWSRFGDKGIMVRGKNGQILLLPFAGYRQGTTLYDAGTDCSYWSSTLDANSPDDAWFLHVSKNRPTQPELYGYYRCQGRSIRPVLHKAKVVRPGNYTEKTTLK
ncbi:MAG: hypothetical protein K6A67_09735 [Bacteroidales bacterium]|nr:hypothetical protein [Bacteroidales bacterium]